MTVPSNASTVPGFGAPVDDAQRVFRSVLEAMARPTTTFPVDVDLTAPGGLGSGAAAIVLTLCDEYTPIWLDATLGSETALAQWIRFHTGAAIVDTPDQAAFAVVSSLAAAPALGALNQGTDIEPHTSATVIVDTAAGAADGRETPLLVSGPGIDGTARWNARDVPAEFVEEWRGRRSALPCGIDLIFAARDTVFALPRTTELTSLVDAGRGL